MTHNEFDFYEDLIKPVMRFLCQLNIMQSRQTKTIDSFNITMGGTIGNLSGLLSGLTDDSSEENHSRDDAKTFTSRKHPLSARNGGINRSISAFERKTISLLN